MVLQVEMNVNNSDIRFPNQLFINNEFIDASDGVTFDTINPADNSVRASHCISSIRRVGSC